MEEKIGRFTILGKLGQGGMGAIYVGNDEALERRAAIKLLLDCEDPTGLQRFLLEARAAASVSHPNICQIYEIGDEAGRPYIAMELLEGEGLHARLSRGALPLGEAIAVTQQLLGGLDEIHRRGFVHRDLKPSNVHLTPHGVKILDFGLARSTASNGATAAIPLTKPGAIVGTPQYMAPEQWTGASVGPATDLFAVGAMLYEMISGRQAFPGETIYEICDAVAHHQPPALSGDAAVVAYDRIIQQAIEKRPAERFSSAKAMAEALRGIQLSMDRGETVPIRQTTRMIALPFRILRPDPGDRLPRFQPSRCARRFAIEAGIGRRSLDTGIRHDRCRSVRHEEFRARDGGRHDPHGNDSAGGGPDTGDGAADGWHVRDDSLDEGLSGHAGRPVRASGFPAPRDH